MSQLIGRVIKVLREDHLVANLGLEHGVQPGDRFVVFEVGEEIVDPESDESLGRIERVKTEVVAFHVQEKMSQLRPMESLDPSAMSAQVLSATLASTALRGGPPRGRSRPPRIAVGDKIRRVTLREADR